MAVLLSIGDFSRMTHLSVKALRHYHDLGLLEPAAVDQFTGYRSYDAAQLPTAQVIRRLRDLGMPLEQVRAVLEASDLEIRNKEIAQHLNRMEEQLDQTRATVAGLRALLEAPAGRAPVEFRSIPATPALAVRSMVTAAEFAPWWMSVYDELYPAVDQAGLTPAGPGGALYPAELFQEEQGEVPACVPVPRAPSVPPGPGGPAVMEIPAVEAAVMLHEGPMDDLDRTYGALGTVVAERAIGVEGPIREYYLVGFRDTDDQSRHRTEVCWPVFQTRGRRAAAPG
jgi:DNA-binding transcriptional MerR regulator/effector-binding domain-containing protein